jgi:2-iminobutanoate/2-iminopropanoate deaminase
VNTVRDIGIAAHIGAYSDAVEVAPGARWLAISGTPGLAPDGSISPNFDDQATQAWSNVCTALDAAGFTVADLVKVTQYLTDPADIPTHAGIRSRFLGEARPASMLVIVPALVWPEMSIEIEAWAARSD